MNVFKNWKKGQFISGNDATRFTVKKNDGEREVWNDDNRWWNKSGTINRSYMSSSGKLGNVTSRRRTDFTVCIARTVFAIDSNHRYNSSHSKLLGIKQNHWKITIETMRNSAVNYLVQVRRLLLNASGTGNIG